MIIGNGIGKPEKIKTIYDLKGKKPIFEIFIYPNIKTVCIKSVEFDLVYEIDWDNWISISDYLLARLQKERPKDKNEDLR